MLTVLSRRNAIISGEEPIQKKKCLALQSLRWTETVLSVCYKLHLSNVEIGISCRQIFNENPMKKKREGRNLPKQKLK